MALVLTFLAVTATISVLLWSVSVFVQPYIYSQMADRLPVRSLIAGLVMGLFITGWTYINTRATPQDKYGTLFEFNPTVNREVTEFDAVRRLSVKDKDGKHREDTVSYKKVPGRTPTEFVEAKNTERKYQLNTSAYMTIALLVPPEGGGDKMRFNAVLDSRGGTYEAGKLFTQERGRRYIEGEYPGMMYEPNPWAAVGAVLLNLMNYVLWFVVFWPVMRYSSGLSLGFAASLGLMTMLVVMPMLFQANRVG